MSPGYIKRKGSAQCKTADCISDLQAKCGDRLKEIYNINGAYHTIKTTASEDLDNKIPGDMQPLEDA